MKGPNNGGMGMRKHGRSGHAGHSPRFKHWMEREARKNEKKRRKSNPLFSLPSEALKNFRPK